MIDAYLDRLARQLRVPPRQRRRVLSEVGDHLADDVARLVAQGLDSSVAEQRAIEAFGTSDLLAAQLNRQAAIATTHRMPLLMVGCGVAVIGGFFGAAIPQRASLPSAAPLLRQVAFFAGVIGIQVAFVAGARTAARVAAVWNAVPSAGDVRLVRRATVVFLSGLVVTVFGWGLAVLDATRTRPDARVLPLIAGLAAMVAGAAVAATAGIRRIDISDFAPGDEAAISPLAIGERAFGWTRNHPVLSCALVGVVSGAAAMGHAETTFAGALPWGFAQAAAVVAGFLALGPALELRT